MADPNALYSYQGQEPRPLPHEIHYQESWGATTFRQSVESFTDEELVRAGYTGPYEVPSVDEEHQKLKWNETKLEYEIIDIPQPSEEELRIQKIYEIRTRRNQLLLNSDWTVLPGSPFTDEEVNSWKEYRQELRDLLKDIELVEDLNTLIWPSINI